jgi:hypothetical protein
MERKMRKYVFCAIVLVCMSTFALGTQAATVMINPAAQDSPPAGGMLTVDVNVVDVAGLFGYQFDLAFDNSALKLTSMEEGEFLGADGTSTIALLNGQMVNFQEGITPDMALEVNSAGVLSVASSRFGSATNVDGTGRLVGITFEVLEAKASTLELQNVTLAGSDAQPIPADLQNGAVDVPAGIKGDVDGNGTVNSRDAILTLRIAVGLIEPTDDQKWAADVREDGEIKSSDAIVILRMAVGLAAPGVDMARDAGGQITVTLAEAHGVAGGSITVPVKVDNTYGLSGGDISRSYDPAVLRAVDVSSDPDVLLVSSFGESGMVHIAFANSHRLSNKTVAKIRFHILADDISPLTVRAVELYNSDALPLISRGIDREFSSWAIPPEHSKLLQNYPNPLNPETWIPYQLKDAGEVTIRIYNTAGELVREIDLGYKPAGLYVSSDRAARWDGANRFGTLVASGVYFYSIQAGDFIAVRKLIVLK